MDPHDDTPLNASQRLRASQRHFVIREKMVREELIARLRGLGERLSRAAESLQEDGFNSSLSSFGEVQGEGSRIDNLGGQWAALRDVLIEVFGLPVGAREALIAAIKAARLEDDEPKPEPPKPGSLAELGELIDAHLKRFEAADEKKHPKDSDRRHFWQAGAHAAKGARFVYVRYISYQGSSHLTREQATRYLAWLDAGNVGRHFEAFREKAKKKA